MNSRYHYKDLTDLCSFLVFKQCVRARPARAWFLKLLLSVTSEVCVVSCGQTWFQRDYKHLRWKGSGPSHSADLFLTLSSTPWCQSIIHHLTLSDDRWPYKVHMRHSNECNYGVYIMCTTELTPSTTMLGARQVSTMTFTRLFQRRHL